MADEVVQLSTAEKPTGDPGPVAVVPAAINANAVLVVPIARDN